MQSYRDCNVGRRDSHAHNVHVNFAVIFDCNVVI